MDQQLPYSNSLRGIDTLGFHCVAVSEFISVYSNSLRGIDTPTSNCVWVACAFALLFQLLKETQNKNNRAVRMNHSVVFSLPDLGQRLVPDRRRRVEPAGRQQPGTCSPRLPVGAARLLRVKSLDTQHKLC